MFFEHLAASADRAKPLVRRLAAAVVPAEVGQRLFALENSSHSSLPGLRLIGRDVSAISGLRQAYFRRAQRVAVRLCPNQSEAFEPEMGFCFAAPRNYGRVHSASSFAQ